MVYFVMRRRHRLYLLLISSVVVLFLFDHSSSCFGLIRVLGWYITWQLATLTCTLSKIVCDVLCVLHKFLIAFEWVNSWRFHAHCILLLDLWLIIISVWIMCDIVPFWWASGTVLASIAAHTRFKYISRIHCTLLQPHYDSSLQLYFARNIFMHF